MAEEDLDRLSLNLESGEYSGEYSSGEYSPEELDCWPA